MLFFKEIFDRRMASGEFKRLFDQECHICSTTVNLVSALEQEKERIPGILASLGISFQDYEDIKQGDKCKPVIVEKLCRHLGVGDPEAFKECPLWPK